MMISEAAKKGVGRVLTHTLTPFFPIAYTAEPGRGNLHNKVRFQGEVRGNTEKRAGVATASNGLER